MTGYPAWELGKIGTCKISCQGGYSIRYRYWTKIIWLPDTVAWYSLGRISCVPAIFPAGYWIWLPTGYSAKHKTIRDEISGWCQAGYQFRSYTDIDVRSILNKNKLSLFSSNAFSNSKYTNIQPWRCYMDYHASCTYN